jgi:hypothetical protein
MTKTKQPFWAALVLLAAMLVVTACNLSALDRPKLKLLPKAIENQWINAVKHHKTNDGATVAEVLVYAEKMRAKEFKVGDIGVSYGGATGEPSGVYIGYWLGNKRLQGDSYVDLGYEMTLDGRIKPVEQDDVMTSALERGRIPFLKAIDDAYTLNCRPDPAEKPDC